MTQRRRALRVSSTLVLALGSLAGGLVLGLQPRTANHFGYALPGPYSLPFRLSYAGRSYSNPYTCAGDSWCRTNGPPRCTTVQWLQSYRYWPLQQVRIMITLFGPVRPVFRAPTPQGMTPMGLYVRIGQDCYLAYSLDGGP